MEPSQNIPARERLEELYGSGLSLYAVGDIFGVSPSTVTKWMKAYDLPRRPRGEATRSANQRRPQGNGSRGGGGYAAHALAVEKTRQKRLALVRAHREEQGCQRCSERHPATLDLHHRDPGGKHKALRMQGAGRTRTRGWADVPLQDLTAELAKCVVLCSNCHRKLEWQERQSPQSPQDDLVE